MLAIAAPAAAEVAGGCSRAMGSGTDIQSVIPHGVASTVGLCANRRSRHLLRLGVFGGGLLAREFLACGVALLVSDGGLKSTGVALGI